MAGTETNVVVGMEIGTSGIAVAVINTGFGARQELTGVGFSPSIGIENGSVTRPHELVSSIRRAVADAEFAAGVEIKKIFVSYDMPGMAVHKAVIRHDIGKHGLSLRELDETLQKLYKSIRNDDHSIVQTIGIRYYIDNEPVLRPENCKGRKLEMKALVVTAPAAPMEALRRCLECSGLKVQQFVAGPLAAAETVLDAAERELGVILVNIGSGLTNAVYFNHGIMKNLGIFPVGGDHVVSDLAVGLHTSLDVARATLMFNGLKDIEGHIELANISGQGEHSVPGDLINRIIRSRIEEIFSFVNDNFIENLKLNASLPGGIVLMGGCSLIDGIAELGESFFEMPVRVGTPRMTPPGITEDEAYRYAGAIGLGLWGSRQIKTYSRIRRRTGGGIFNRLTKWR
ncbi:cell division protein FtsA [Desulfotruncus alcoholivorax]|uniref:cell division protein FtsA n=1 Tax=Desulfotruncus alcoholivorax TaxID=265477 RepID=UPI0003FA59A0|nr:cell division protein FtsA [Desulfotruncus alcoholivorax]